MGHIFENVGLQGVASNNLNFFDRITADHQSNYCGHILAKIN